MNCAYVTLLTTDDYLPVVLTLKATMEQVKTKYPLYCMVTYEVSEGIIGLLKNYDIEAIRVCNIKMPPQITARRNKFYEQQGISPNQYFYETINKFWAFKLTQFDKIIYVDSDLYLKKNLDHLFEYQHMTAVPDGESIIPFFEKARGYKDTPTGVHHTFNAGLIVIQPSENEFNDLLNYFYHVAPNIEDMRDDQEILTGFAEYKYNWVEEKKYHLSEKYNIFAPHLDEYYRYNPDFNENDVYVYHFVGLKPIKLDYASAYLFDYKSYRNQKWWEKYKEYIKTFVDFTERKNK